MKYLIKSQHKGRTYKQYCIEFENAMDLFKQWRYTEDCETCELIDRDTNTVILAWKKTAKEF